MDWKSMARGLRHEIRCIAMPSPIVSRAPTRSHEDEGRQERPEIGTEAEIDAGPCARRQPDPGGGQDPLDIVDPEEQAADQAACHQPGRGGPQPLGRGATERDGDHHRQGHPGRHRRGRPDEQAGAQQQASAGGADHLAGMGHARREHRVPEQDHAGEPDGLNQQEDRARLVVRRPDSRRDRLDDVVRRRHADPQQEPGAEEGDAPQLLGGRRVGAHRDEDHRGQRQHVRGGDGGVEEREVDRSIEPAGARCRPRRCGRSSWARTSVIQEASRVHWTDRQA